MSEVSFHRPIQDRPIEPAADEGQFAKAYGLGGKELPLDHPDVCAKVHGTVLGTSFYRVRVGRDGLLFDPFGLVNGATTGRQRESEPDSFKRINQKGFELYLKYLESRNPAWLRNAEREVING